MSTSEVTLLIPEKVAAISLLAETMSDWILSLMTSSAVVIPSVI